MKQMRLTLKEMLREIEILENITRKEIEYGVCNREFAQGELHSLGFIRSLINQKLQKQKAVVSGKSG